MNAKIHQQLVNRKSRIERRLDKKQRARLMAHTIFNRSKPGNFNWSHNAKGGMPTQWQNNTQPTSLTLN